MARSQHVQTTLLPPEVVEATLRLGMVGAADHIQVQIDVVDPGTGELLARWMDPHKPYEALGDLLRRSTAELEAMVRELTGPF